MRGRKEYAKCFSPLLNDDETFNEFLRALGGPPTLRFELAEVLQTTPAPPQQMNIHGALVTLDCGSTYEEERDRKEAAIERPWNPSRTEEARSFSFVPQTVDNACGVISLLNLCLHARYGKHANQGRAKLTPTEVSWSVSGKLLEDLYKAADRGTFVQQSQELEDINERLAGTNYGGEEPDGHHIAICCSPNGSIYEVDGDQDRRGPALLPVTYAGSGLAAVESFVAAMQASYSNLVSVLILLETESSQSNGDDNKASATQ